MSGILGGAEVFDKEYRPARAGRCGTLGPCPRPLPFRRRWAAGPLSPACWSRSPTRSGSRSGCASRSRRGASAPSSTSGLRHRGGLAAILQPARPGAGPHRRGERRQRPGGRGRPAADGAPTSARRASFRRSRRGCGSPIPARCAGWCAGARRSANTETSGLRHVGVIYDVTESKRAEVALRELNDTLEARVREAVAERERAEEQLRQSQKMEAVGQLTGASPTTSTTCSPASSARST